MNKHSNRRNFLGKSSLGALALLGLPQFTYARDLLNPELTDLPPEFPAQDRASVREVVGASHGNFDRVKELVNARPELSKATWDWGFGDWESALGAASHMGRRDIAEFLMEHGARPDIFTFAMLGNIDAVRGMVESTPGVQRIPGPHGITLMRHVRIRMGRKGVSDADKKNLEAVIEYLEWVGGADENATSLDITEEERNIYLGKYTFGPNENDIFDVVLSRQGMSIIGRGEEFGRALLRVEEHGFAPGGAPSVRVRFDVTDGKATAVTIHDPEPVVKAVRV